MNLINALSTLSTLQLNATLLPTTTEHIHGHHVHIDVSFILQEVFLGLVALFGFIGNCLVCYTVVKRTQVKHSTWYFLCSLSISDAFVCLVNVPTLMYTTYDEDVIDNGTFLCQFNGFSLVCLFLVSVLTLAAISIHKYFHIRQPLQSRASNKSLQIIIGIWVVSIIIALGPLVGWSQYTHVHGHKQCIPASSSALKQQDNGLDYSYLVVLIFIGFFLPLVSMVYCYAAIFIETILHNKRLKSNSIRGDTTFDRRTGRRNSTLRIDWGILKTIFVVVTTFVVCWSPFVVYICYNFQQDSVPSFTLAQFAFMMGYTQSILNPIIYALRHELFRNQFKSVICCLNYMNVDVARSESYGRSGSGNLQQSGSVFLVDATRRGSLTSESTLVFYQHKDSSQMPRKAIGQSSYASQGPKLDSIKERGLGSVLSYENEMFTLNNEK